MGFGVGREFGLLFLLGAFLDLKGSQMEKSAHWRCHTKTNSSGNAPGCDIKWDIPLGVLEVRTPSREDAQVVEYGFLSLIRIHPLDDSPPDSCVTQPKSPFQGILLGDSQKWRVLFGGQ